MNCVNNAGFTPIHAACQAGDKESLRFMLNRPDAFSSINAATYAEKLTPLHLASSAPSENSIHMCEMLVRKGGALTFRDSQGNTPYLRAIQSRNYESFKFLASQSSDTSAVNKAGMTALHFAAKSGAVEAAMLCTFRADLHARVTKTIRLTPLHLAASGGHGPLCTYLIDCGTQADTLSLRGATALHLAAGNGQRDSVLVLLRLGASIEARDDKGRTPLFRAVLCGSLPCVAALLDADADPNASNAGSYIPLQYTCMRRDTAILSLLLAHPLIDVNARDQSNHTALHWAALEGNIGCVSLLLERHADLGAKDVEGNTPAVVATLRGHNDIADLLHARAGVFNL